MNKPEVPVFHGEVFQKQPTTPIFSVVVYYKESVFKLILEKSSLWITLLGLLAFVCSILLWKHYVADHWIFKVLIVLGVAAMRASRWMGKYVYPYLGGGLKETSALHLGHTHLSFFEYNIPVRDVKRIKIKLSAKDAHRNTDQNNWIRIETVRETYRLGLLSKSDAELRELIKRIHSFRKYGIRIECHTHA